MDEPLLVWAAIGHHERVPGGVIVHPAGGLRLTSTSTIPITVSLGLIAYNDFSLTYVLRTPSGRVAFGKTEHYLLADFGGGHGQMIPITHEAIASIDESGEYSVKVLFKGSPLVSLGFHVEFLF